MATCVRSAWLTLSGQTLYLEDTTKGYFCVSLDLGSPTVRENMSDMADQNGAYDRTTLLGARSVSAEILAIAGAGARIDDIADNFGPYMNPAVRPVLHYVLDRPGTPERILTVRGANYSWPITGPYQRDIQLQWVAADPIARDPTTKTVTILPSTSQPVSTPGDVGMNPLIRLFGPFTSAVLATTLFTPGQPNYVYQLTLSGATPITDGHWIDIDCQKHTIFLDSDPAQAALAAVNWSNSRWVYIPASPITSSIAFTANGSGANTKAQLMWNDGYLT